MAFGKKKNNKIPPYKKKPPEDIRCPVCDSKRYKVSFEGGLRKIYTCKSCNYSW